MPSRRLFIATAASLATDVGIQRPTPLSAFSREHFSSRPLPGGTELRVYRQEQCPDSEQSVEDAAMPGTEILDNNVLIRLEQLDARLGKNVITVRSSQADGTPLTGALVFLTVSMPSMDHGVSAYPAHEVSAGRFRARDVSLGMAGEWIVTSHVIRQARAPAEGSYNVMVSESE